MSRQRFAYFVSRVLFKAAFVIERQARAVIDWGFKIPPENRVRAGAEDSPHA